MVLYIILGLLALLSFGLNVWQWFVALRFPLHRRTENAAHFPPVTLLKPLKGADAATAACLRSWLAQDYPGPVQVLMGVASAEDPVCGLVHSLIADYPEVEAQLIICPESLGPNAKVSTLIQLESLIRHEVVVISDADVYVPSDLLRQVVLPLQQETVGLVNCFYELADPSNAAMHWEAVAINADFWSQVLQARSLKPLDFALGAVMATRRNLLTQMGGFVTLVDYLADDYQLGHQVAAGGAQIELCPIAVECRSAPLSWREVWTHQLRWARTIRVCQPGPYFLSVLNNATFWPLVWLTWSLIHWPNPSVAGAFLGFDATNDYPFTRECTGYLFLVFLLARIVMALDLQARLTRSWRHWIWFWMVPVKDLSHLLIWALSFLGNRVSWRGGTFNVLRGGKLVSKQDSILNRKR